MKPIALATLIFLPTVSLAAVAPVGKTGALLLCAQDTRKPPITGRRGALVALSHDDGATWAHVRPVPEVGGYMSAAQAPNGMIYLFGTRMTCVAFNEAWVKQAPPIK